MGKDSFTYGALVADFALAAALMTMLVVSQAAVAESDAAHSPVPQTLLLKFLADNETFTLVDARSSAEFDKSHINGAINVPHDAPDDTLSLLPSELSSPIVVYCKTGKRAGELKTKLIERGYTDVRVLLPEQIHWFDGMAVFNCGVPADGQSGKTFTKSMNEGNREGEL